MCAACDGSLRDLVRDEQIVLVGSGGTAQPESRLGGTGLIDRPADRGVEETELIIDLGRYYRVTSAILSSVAGRDVPAEVEIRFDDGTGNYQCVNTI